MPFDPATYVPKDPWTSADFLTRALVGPWAQVAATTIGNTTPPSYFEYRSKDNDCVAEVSVAGSGTAVLERSFDNGATWQIVKTYAGANEDTYPVNSLMMLRLRLTVASGTTNLSLRQEL